MQKTIKFPIVLKEFKEKLLAWSNRHDSFCLFDSNDYYNNSPDKKFECIAALGRGNYNFSPLDNIDDLHSWLKLGSDWYFCFISYDLKNRIENLSSSNPDFIGFPMISFFTPGYIFEMTKKEVIIHYNEVSYLGLDVEEIFNEINNYSLRKPKKKNTPPNIKQRVTKEEYIENINKIRQHIQLGDVYEMNYCIEFFVEDFDCDPIQVYQKLNKISPMPFACYYKNDDKYLLCASPERFLMKRGNKLISQPIKGTIKRDLNNKEYDKELRNQLLNDQKERAENVMIVDLVRNDLSRTAKKGSVKVEELFGIYSFKQVHQMISTVSSEVKDEFDFVDILKTTFPMGSMTGAPKIRAMELIEKYEKTKRGLYSGSVGYITPEQDFDFNVVIRSIQYNSSNKYLSFMVGSAITFDSIPEKEYEECLVKAQAIMEVLTSE